MSSQEPSPKITARPAIGFKKDTVSLRSLLGLQPVANGYSAPPLSKRCMPTSDVVGGLVLSCELHFPNHERPRVRPGSISTKSPTSKSLTPARFALGEAKM